MEREGFSRPFDTLRVDPERNRAGRAFVIRGRRVILPGGERAASIHIDNGSIVRVGLYDDVAGASPVIDAGRAIVGPGLVDTHVHVNEPGRTDWEGFDTATRAAAAGGVTTIVDMPLNSVPASTTAAALDAKRACAGANAHVDVAFWGGLVPGNITQLEPLLRAGARGFKCFLVPSGVDEFPAVGEADLRQALPILARRDVPLLVHAESPRHITDPDGPGYASFLASRPPLAESAAIAMAAAAARAFGAHLHVVHVASAEAVDEVLRAKVNGVKITAETCPHYLTFAADDIPEGATEFKCAPPIREARHRAALWSALRADILTMVASDHSPAPPSMKAGPDFRRAWGGIASLELSLDAVWTAAGDAYARFTRHPQAIAPTFVPWTAPPQPAELFRWMSTVPAQLAGLAPRKGSLAVGADADLVIWDPDAERAIDPARLQQRHKVTPYAQRRLRGSVKTTFVRGRRVWHHGALDEARSGRLI